MHSLTRPGRFHFLGRVLPGPIRLWPRTLAARTALVLLAGLILVQMAGLGIYALDRGDAQRIVQLRDIGQRTANLYRTLALMRPPRRAAALAGAETGLGIHATLDSLPPLDPLPPAPPWLLRELRASVMLVAIPAELRPLDIAALGGPDIGQLVIGLRLPEGDWLNARVDLSRPRLWDSRLFMFSFLAMSMAASLLTLWAVSRLTAPVATLAAAADALGRDVNAPPLPTGGPAEVATAATAFNTMAARIRRFVQDRTFMLTAIGHDLRTPITRLRLRAEFVEDETQRQKMLDDLDELEAMVSATLAFGRDSTQGESVSVIDLAELARTVLDETADARPELTERLDYRGIEHLPVRVRPLSLKRALANLIGNAAAYGGSAHVTLGPPTPAEGGSLVRLTIDDDGPGIDEADLDRVFQPFQRLEASRNRETGGVGLGLPIARNILRAHGGDVTLENRPQGGTRATVLLPV